ncbi:MAG TPA: outer membrane protein [Xanthobacteraceae bacterium]|nr:outer membrane protein [Xanthobacteraceae bacterium]
MTFAAPVAAANLPLKAPPVETSWAGYYVGVHGGWGWADTVIPNGDQSTPVFPQSDIPNSGPLAGGQIGANWQYGNLVYGAEIDASWVFLVGTLATSQVIPGSGGLNNNAIDFRALGTATGRVGYAMNSWLFYAKGGAAWASVRLNVQEDADPVPVERNLFGPTAGAGVEVAFLRNVSAKVEYDFNYFLPDSTVIVPTHDPVGIYHFVHVVKAGINVRFGGEPPLPRQYTPAN